MNYDLFQTYHDLFLPKEERENMLRHGISSENMRKLRTNAGDKDTSTAKEVAMAALHNTKYCIPLDHPILTDHGVFYPKSLPHPLKFEISLAPVSDVVVFSDTTKQPTYEITNLELECRCISSKFLADQAQAAYKNNHAFFYENILHHKTFTFSKKNDTVINEQINVPRRSMTGILLLFTENPTAGERDSEKFVNPVYNVSSDKYRWSAEHVIFQRNVADGSVGVNKATFPAKSGIRSYGNKILHRRQVCFVD